MNKNNCITAYLWNLSRGQRGRILKNCLLGMLSTAFALGFVYTSKQLIDIATGACNGNLKIMTILTIVMLALQLLCSSAETWIAAHMEVDMANALRHSLFKRLLHIRWNVLEKLHTGDIVNRVEQDTSTIVTLLTASMPTALVTVVQFMAGFAFFYMLDPVLPWIVVGFIPLFMLGARFYTHRMKRLTHEVRTSDSRIQALIQESLQNRTVIKTLGQDESCIRSLGALQDTLRIQVMKRAHFSLSARMAVSAAFAGGYVSALIWGAFCLSTGSITVGTLTAFIQLVARVQRPAFELSRLIPSVTNALTAAERLLELEHLPAEDEGKPISFENTPVLSIKNLHFAYSEGDSPVFRNFSHSFLPGTCTAIMGETGRGKTTLVRLLLALAEPQDGSITLSDDSRICPISIHTRVNFVYVPQGNTLFSGTIRDNLLMGKPDATQAELDEALYTAVALDFVRNLPEGINTILGEQGANLSEGQAQRIAIARSLLRPGRILLLDEATSSLDPETELTFIKRLQCYASGKTLLLVTHHPVLAAECDTTLQL